MEGSDEKLSVPATFKPDAGVKMPSFCSNTIYPWLTNVKVTDDFTIVALDLSQAPFGELIFEWYNKAGTLRKGLN